MIKFDKIKFCSKLFKMHFKPFPIKKILSFQAKNGLWDLVSGRVGPPETKSQDPQVQKFFLLKIFFCIILSNLLFFITFLSFITRNSTIKIVDLIVARVRENLHV